MTSPTRITLTIVAFGIAKEILGAKTIDLFADKGCTIREIKNLLLNQYPDFMDLKSLKLAINAEYATDDIVVRDGDEIVIIPPVSGG